MAPRHIYNPTILRGRGRLPVPLSSCDIALHGREAAWLFNTTMFTGISARLKFTREKLKGHFYIMIFTS